MFIPFLDCLHEFDPKNAHMMLALMFEPRFKDLFIMNNYVGRNMATIATRHNFETRILILCSTYRKMNDFAKPTKTFVTLE